METTKIKSGLKKMYLQVITFVLLIFNSYAQHGTVNSYQKISAVEGNFSGTLNIADHFSYSITSIGDLDGDGITDIAIGALDDEDGGNDRGAVWILFLNADKTVNSYQKISDTKGNFTGNLDNSDRFGSSLTSLGDLDGDGVTDIATGARFDDDGPGGNNDRGAVWILFLNSNGTVKSHQKISDTKGGFTGTLDDTDLFGNSVTSLGDLDGDGITDIAVGAQNDDDGGTNRGAVWILFLNQDGTVKSHQKISDTQGNFAGILDNTDSYGSSVASIGDLDGDGVTDIIIGAYQDDDGGYNRGAIWVLFMNPDGTVKSHQKISNTQGNFTGIMDNYDFLGYSISSLGDLDGDGVTDILAGTLGDDDGGNNRGAVWVLFLNTDGSVKSFQKISSTQGNFTDILNNDDFWGWSVGSLGDLNGDSLPEIAVGAYGDDDGTGTGNTSRGAVWVLSLNKDVVLPIELLSFSGSTINPNAVLLTWETNTETNNDYFTIERSNNSAAFESIAEIKGAGNSNTKQHYTYRDENPLYGISYYRLKQTDFDGNFSYSQIVSVTLTNESFELINVKPNPTEAIAVISYNSNATGIVILKIYKLNGEVMLNNPFETTQGINEIVINVSSYQKGMYFIALENETNNSIRSKLVKY
ncbi:MAG: T9SS type A sorting domain-containing protein [Cytophagales bacterium]|nr:T9SS type A sorting domain-containing protein [Cytophagales bacterium]